MHSQQVTNTCVPNETMCIDICAWIWATSFVILSLHVYNTYRMCFPESTLSCCFSVKDGLIQPASQHLVRKQAKISGIATPVKGLIFYWAPVKTCLVRYVVLAVLMQEACRMPRLALLSAALFVLCNYNLLHGCSGTAESTPAKKQHPNGKYAFKNTCSQTAPCCVRLQSSWLGSSRH